MHQSDIVYAPYHGISLVSKWSLYRFHIEDPVRFKKSIKVTIEHGSQAST
ncbi:DUF2961 domain-containing protein [Paenibacillus puerhi]